MARPDYGDWTSVRGQTRLNSDQNNTPIQKLGASQDIVINDLNVTEVQNNRWSNTREDNPIGIFDSERGTEIGET